MTAVYGCHNREPLKDHALVPSGSVSIGYGVLAKAVRTIPDPMSKDCKYTHTDLGRKDAKCGGCKHRAIPVSPAGAD